MTALPRTRAVLVAAVDDRVFPGAIVEIGHRSGRAAHIEEGRLSYRDDAARVEEDTVYDLASLTKVLATTTLAMELVQSGRVRLNDRVRRWTDWWTGDERQSVTVQDLLEHCSGLPAHRRYFETRRGRASFEAAICQEPLAYAPRTQSIYSDAGFMLLGFLLERAADTRLEQWFDAWRASAIGDDMAICYLPPSAWIARMAPTEDDPLRGDTLVGRVHDGNAEALDGVAGHAGLFGTAGAVGACARWWMRRMAGEWSSATAVTRRFVERSHVPASSRALGWDGMLPTSSCGTRLSSDAIGHTGFTGTSLWIDLTNDLYVVVLSNRVHPSRDGNAMKRVRAAIHDAVAADLALP